MIRLSAAVIFLAAIWAGCAQVREPQGGPKDTTPPVLIFSDPADGSIQFSGQRIVLHFNERIKLDRVREKLLISPPLPLQPDVAVAHGSDVVITLKAPLAANTTYTFNIGEAVLDLSEGNPATGLSYVVSTGAYVDSLVITGQVTEAFSGIPALKVLVLLHAVSDSGDVRTASPAYFTRTDGSGQFKLTHLRSGNFQINALDDKNANFRFDLPNEEIAFTDSAIDPSKTTSQHLFLFRPAAKTQFVVQARVNKDRGWQLVLARPAAEVVLHSLDRTGGDLHWWPEWSASRDTVVLWPSDTTLLNGQRFSVTEEGSVLDTLTYRANSAMPFNIAVVCSRDPGNGLFSLIASRPVAAFDTGHAELRVDSIRYPFEVRLDSSDPLKLHVALDTRIAKNASLVLYPKAVIDLIGGTNDTTRLELGVPDPRTQGRLSVRVIPDSGAIVNGPFVLELRTSKDQVVRSILADSLPINVSWEGLVPGSYGLKMIEDRDGNGAWSTGSFDAGRQPERVRILLTPVSVRAGWAVETTWDLPAGDQ